MNIETIVFMLNAFEKFKSTKKSVSEFSKRIDLLYMEGQIDENERKVLKFIVNDGKSEKIDLPIEEGIELYTKHKISDGNGCSIGPSYEYKLYTPKKAKKLHMRTQPIEDPCAKGYRSSTVSSGCGGSSSSNGRC